MENNICSCAKCGLEIYENNNRHLRKLKKIKWSESLKQLTLRDFNHQWIELCKKSNTCILHCKKSNQYREDDRHYLYTNFNTALILEIAKQLESFSNNDNAIVDKESAIKILNGTSIEELFKEEDMQYKVTNSFSKMILLTNIIFPPRKSQDSFDYEQVLIKLKAIQFNFCEFNTHNLLLDNITCFFADCIFVDDWGCPPCLKWERRENIYQACTFKGNVSNYSFEDRDELLSTYSVPLFDYLCTFEKKIEFKNVKFKKPFFYSSVEQQRENKKIAKEISFKDCIFEDSFKLNNLKINHFLCEDTIFSKKSKFEFKNNEVDKFEIRNTNFNILVDCFETRFQSFYIEKSIFEKFTGFEKCEFGKFKKEDNVVVFEYATFLDFVNFRDAEFDSGLDLRNANFKEAPNFLDVKVEPKNTNRETFRIIKHSFDKVGNLIEANKYFAYEMDKERQDIKFWKSPSKFLSLQLNYFISDFGQTFLIPLLWILTISMLHSLVISWFGDYELTTLNSLVQNIMPYKKLLRDVEGKEFISLFFGVVYMILIYNVIIAIKRITKR